MEKKAVCVHGSLEKIAKLEADRLKLENDLKHLKFLYGGLNEKKTSQPDKTVVVEVSVHLVSVTLVSVLASSDLCFSKEW